MVLLALATAFGTACKSEPGEAGASCKAKDDCVAGLNCLDGKCTKLEDEAAPEPTGYCATLAALAGSWTFDTTVIGAEDLAPRGINGHFQMTVTVDNCEGKIALTKSGYDDVVFSNKKIQQSDAALSESQLIPHAAEATVSLKGKPTHTMTFVVRDGQLFGYYHYAASEWTRAGMWGHLRGVAAGQDLAEVEDFSAQPCEVRCLTQCDATRRGADATLDEPALAACMTACGGDEPIVGCGPGEPLPDELVVAVNGPVKSLDELCGETTAKLLAANGLEGAGIGRCDRKPKIKDKPTLRKLGKGRLDGSFSTAQLVEVGYFDVGYTGHLILALETEAGWFWTAPLADLSMAGVGGVSVTTQSLTLRPKDLLSAVGREVVAEISVETTDSDLGVNEVSIDDTKRAIVCSAGSPPVCMRVTTDWSSQRTLIDPDVDNDPNKHPDLGGERGEVYIAFLPGDLVSISTPAEARAEDRELAGIYAWPE
ncbi:hypothetical protein ENSA5_36100 [Enhygromyxa salina]|uniref:Uncharacterized protein n=2 Tax=Enhygromyxa salina TaxID=215803 RepID=A0A2S9XUM4_9BACT|nr:hypothetical protein ENSA5_36100 [Enhygromyxa salina]